MGKTQCIMQLRAGTQNLGVERLPLMDGFLQICPRSANRALCALARSKVEREYPAKPVVAPLAQPTLRALLKLNYENTVYCGS